MTRRDLLDAQIEVFSTCPMPDGAGGDAYAQQVAAVARWSEEAGCKGILVYSDNSKLDPWLVSQIIIQNTRSLCPLVAVQPVYMHPYSVAKMIASFGYLYRRRLYLNLVAGGFKNDLIALNDTTPHDKRYQRLIEYTTVIMRLLAGTSAVSYEGDYYKVDKLKLAPPLREELLPGIFVSGSSEAGLAAANELGATAIKYPQPAQENEGDPTSDAPRSGVRVGIITRDTESKAWQVARARFPEDRKGQLTHQLAMKVSDSVWHQQLSDARGKGDSSPYWLEPFQNYKTACPYLVGSYTRVAGELAAFITAGHRTFIVDIPSNSEDLDHINIAFQRALEVSKCGSYCKTG